MKLRLSPQCKEDSACLDLLNQAHTASEQPGFSDEVEVANQHVTDKSLLWGNLLCCYSKDTTTKDLAYTDVCYTRTQGLCWHPMLSGS